MTSNNNIPQGYKQTELGIIPEDWDTIKICEGLADVKSGKRLPYGYYVTDKRTKHPYIRVIDMYDGGIDTSNLMYVPEEAYKSIEKYRIFKDDIFISVAGTLGIVGKIPSWLDGANLTENANRLTNITCCRDYLLYYLRSPYIQDVISSEQTIGAQPKLALNRIRNFEIALPSSDTEQKAIATALSDVDALIVALDKKIAKKKLIKQGAMQQLLTGKKRLPGFTDDWVEKKLEEICDIIMGQSPSSIYYNIQNVGLPLIQGNADLENRQQIVRYYTSQITKVCEEGDVILSVRAPVGAVGKAIHKSCLGRGVCAIKISNDYIYHYLIYIEEDWNSFSKGSTFDSINSDELNKFSLSLPITVKEQQAIATILSDMDKEIFDLEAKRDKYNLIKQGMMQKLLTGQIRLRY
jgi:type I restriction enzyme S subunit